MFSVNNGAKKELSDADIDSLIDRTRGNLQVSGVTSPGVKSSTETDKAKDNTKDSKRKLYFYII